MKSVLKTSWRSVVIAILLSYAASAAIGANVLVALGDYAVDPQIIGIKVGDTVTWYMASSVSNFTESLGGEWKSPSFTNTGATFSYTFTNAGFFVYRTARAVGTITVKAWTNPPPPVEIVWPVDDFLPLGVGRPILITPAFSWPTGEISKVDIFLNGSPLDLLGDTNTPASISSPPYRIQWLMPQPGALTARVTDKQGNTGWSPAVNLPVFIGAPGGAGLFLPRRLPTGQFMFYYGVAMTMQGGIGYADTLSLLDPRNGFGVYGYGVYVDFSATHSPHRFYSIIAVPAP